MQWNVFLRHLRFYLEVFFQGHIWVITSMVFERNLNPCMVTWNLIMHYLTKILRILYYWLTCKKITFPFFKKTLQTQIEISIFRTFYVLNFMLLFSAFKAIFHIYSTFFSHLIKGFWQISCKLYYFGTLWKGIFDISSWIDRNGDWGKHYGLKKLGDDLWSSYFSKQFWCPVDGTRNSIF